MSSDAAPGSGGSVRFSRFMRLRWVTALGASISVGLGVYILLGPLLLVAGQQSLGPPYLVMAIIAVPIILTYAERAGVTPGSGGAYNLARMSGLVWLTYASGWLLLGGYVALIAVLGWGVALYLDLLAQHLFGQEFDLSQLAVAVIGVAAFYSTVGTQRNWRVRSAYVYLSIIVLLVVITKAIFSPVVSETTSNLFHSTTTILSVTALMMSGLWGLQFILNTRDEISRPTRTLPRAMLLTVALGAGLGMLAALAINRSGTLPTSLIPLGEILSDSGPIPKNLLLVIYATAGLLISSIALNQAVVHPLRLVGEMTRDGYFPQRLQNISKEFNTAVIPLCLLTISSILLVILLPIIVLVGLTALLFLWLTAIVHLPESFSAKPKLPEKRFPKLPFHPLFPWLTIAAGVFLPFNLKYPEWLLAGGWLLASGVYYLAYARQGGHSAHRRDVLIGESSSTPAEIKAKFVVLVCISNPKTAPDLIKAGARVAKARHGKLLALKVLALAEQMPNNLKRKAAQKEWESLTKLVEKAKLEDVPVETLVRLAPNPTTGIMEAVEEEGADLLFLGWEGEHPPGDGAVDSIVDPILKRAKCDVAILRGTVPQVVKHALVPTAGGPFAPIALKIGVDLAENGDGTILVETMVEEHLSTERKEQAETDLQATLKALKNGPAVKQRVVQVDDVRQGIISNAGSSDLLLIGASKKGFPERAFFGGLSVEVAQECSTPTILARSPDTQGQFWLWRLWGALADALPSLTLARQAEVYQNMRESAQPTVDFFVLITLSAIIASLGLLQNSAAVIIGAMLVAPLMSPILAMAMSIVRADLKLLVVAAEATAKGSVLAILVGVAVVIISPIDAATSEILARTQPNVLDLMVALASGAAAGYAISRKEVAAALPGVAIAAALVPPLCVVGYGLGTSQLGIATGSLLLFITNLIAIIFAAALIFLALGFHPERSEQGEFIRGLQITVISLVVIFVILAFTTMVSVLQISQQNAVEQIFTKDIVARAGEVRELNIDRQFDRIIITTTIIDLDQQLTPSQIAEIDKQLEETFLAPVTIEATILPGVKSDFDDYDRRRELEIMFENKVTEHGAEIIVSAADVTEEGFIINAALIATEEQQLTQTDLTAIQQELSQAMGAPVAVHVTILPGAQINLEASDSMPPTPTPEP